MTFPRPAQAQRLPIPSDNPSIQALVCDDIETRRLGAIAKYNGPPVQAFNGRSPLIDQYQEALDQLLYLRQQIEEQRQIWAIAVELNEAMATANPEQRRHWYKLFAALSSHFGIQ